MQKREIRFRAWNREKRLMSEPFEADTICAECSSYTVEGDEYFRFYDCELLQFTGLRDKDGKEVYEGDVVKDMKTPPNIGIVIWHAGAFYLEWQMRSYDGTKPVEMSTDRCFEYATVIGSVFENPELIKNG